MRTSRRGVWLPFVTSALLTAAGFTAGYAVRGLLEPGARLALVRQAHTLVVEHHVGPLPSPAAIEAGMIDGMLRVLDDPFTIHVEPALHALETDLLTGEYGGIGVRLTRDQAGAVRLVPAPGGPAARAGIGEGDVLLAIDDRALGRDETLYAVEAALRGPVGSIVRLGLGSHEAGRPARAVAVARAAMALPSVSGFILPDDPATGVLALTLFSERTPEEVAEALASLQVRGAHRLIIDLRGNPGGLLEAAVETARLFLREGVVLFDVDRAAGARAFAVERPGPAAAVPVAVLIDGGTASAAEIFAAALRAGGAALIGQPTYGKGSVQSIFGLDDGSSLHLTTSRWLTPAGEALDGRGLEPDVRVEAGGDGGAEQALFAAALRWLADEGAAAQ